MVVTHMNRTAAEPVGESEAAKERYSDRSDCVEHNGKPDDTQAETGRGYKDGIKPASTRPAF